MKTRIDLYLPELKPRYELVTVGLALTLLLLSGLVVGGATLWAKNASEDVLVEAKQIDATYQGKKKLGDALKAQRDARSKDPTLVANIDELQRMLSGRRAILSELKKQEQLKSQGFSDLMRGLALSQQDDLWLTRVRVEEQQLLLVGGASGSASLPRWVSKLQEAPFFMGKQFEAARLYRDQDDLLVFEIGTLIDGEQQENQTQ